LESDIRYIFVIYTLEFVSNTTLLGLYNPFSNPNAYPKRVSLRFGYALGLEKGLYNPNRVVFDTTLRACGTTVRVLMPL
jgi:hypothetical protein